MTIEELLAMLPERLRDSASVERVFGEPIRAGDKTIVPVARVAYGFGGGLRPDKNGLDPSLQEGGGGGGGVGATPVGVFEITPEATRFIPAGNKKKLLLAVGGGLFLGWLLARRR